MSDTADVRVSLERDTLTEVDMSEEDSPEGIERATRYVQQILAAGTD